MNKEAEQLKQDIEAYKQSEQEASEIIAELKAENKKLRHSNENLRLALKTYEMPEVVKVLTDWRTGKLDLRINKYKQTLQEIKAICKMDCGDCQYNQDCDCNFEECEEAKIDDIVDLITKAEEE